MAQIQVIEPVKKILIKRKRVAAYARVSMETEKLQHSLSAQISRYSELIQSNPDWEYAGVFSDDGISGGGTSKRTGFKELMEECDKGHINIILVKSISRFARNTVDLIESVRHLKAIGVEVRFEDEHISTMSGDGELLLTLLAAFAQAESESISANVRWSRRKKFEQGLPHAHYHIYGYRWADDDLVIVPEEAEVVRRCFRNYLNGISPEKTEAKLAAEGITNTYGDRIDGQAIRKMLINVFYTGNMVFQRYYSDESVPHKMHVNYGQMPKYYVENTHEAIIPMETFREVQDEIKRREDGGYASIPGTNCSCLTGKLVCGHCGHNYTRTSRRSGKHGDGEKYYVWRCSTSNRKGADRCPAKRIREAKIMEATCDVLGLKSFDADVFDERVDHITIADSRLDFILADGTTATRVITTNGNQDSWTEERRRQQGERVRQQWKEGVRHGRTGSSHNTSD